MADKLISNNGFSSHEFNQFAQQYGFQHVTSSPHFPQANGLAERYVQTATNLLKKAKQAGTDPYLALLSYRNTPADEKLGSPCQRLFGRRTKTTLPTSSSLLQPSLIQPKEVQEALQKRKEKQKLYFDRHSKDLPELKMGDSVRYETNKGLKSAQLIEKRKEPRFYMIRTANGMVLRRNRRHLYKGTGVYENQPPRKEVIPAAEQIDPPHVIPAAEQVPSQLYRTLSGRTIRQPDRYQAL